MAWKHVCAVCGEPSRVIFHCDPYEPIDDITDADS